MKIKYSLILIALGLELALVLVLGSRDGAAVAAPGTEGHIEALSAPAAEGSTELADVLHVCPSGCTYSSIQDAVDAANDGDVIKVAAGTYTGVSARPAASGYDYPPSSGLITQVVYISKTVSVRGGYTTDNWTTSDPENNPTTLDAQGQGRVFLIAGSISITIEGLRITGGDAAGLGGGPWQWAHAGGGVYVLTTTAVFSNNHVFGNTAEWSGGGLCLSYSDATLSHNTITDNTASIGGGLFLGQSPATLSGNTISNNSVDYTGGGLYLEHSDATLSGNTISNNTTDEGWSRAGGLYLEDTDATLNGNTISGNGGSGVSWERGVATLRSNVVSGNSGYGGLLLWASASTLSGNTIRGNNGGGVIGDDLTLIENTIYSNGGGGVAGNHLTLIRNTIYSNTAGQCSGLNGYDVTLINNIIADNQAIYFGGGLCVGGSSHLLHNTIAHNTGGDDTGMYVHDGTAALTNTILADHSVGISVTDNSTVTINGVLWHNTPITVSQSVMAFVNAQNQHKGAPAFVDPDNGDYHIGPTSAAIDAGVASRDTSLCLFDIDGDPRPAAFGFDIGADERPGTSLHTHKAAWPASVNGGQTFTYTLVISSAGTDTATDIWVTDTLPILQQAVDITTSQGSCTAGPGWGSTATCDLGTLVPGASAHITLTAQVTTTPPAQLPWRMRNTVWISAAETKNTTYADTTLHDCHVRLNDGPTEYSTVQAGVDASIHPGDVVKVSGYCAGVTSRTGLAQIVYLDKTLTLQGGWNSAFTQRDATRFPTTLDAWGQGRVLYITTPGSGAGISPTVEGLNLTGGDAAGLGSGLWDTDAGGGVYVLRATARINNSQVFNNAADSGGGLFLDDSDATLSGNIVFDNTAEWDGGGLYLSESNATLSDNTISNNSAESSGGGLYLEHSDATLSDNIVSRNTASGRYSDGGGLYLWESDATLSGNTVSSNTANGGGGLYLSWSDATLSGNIITANSDGGGLCLSYSDATLSGNTISNNSADGDAGGLYLDRSDATLNGNTIIANTTNSDAGGLYLWQSDATLSGNTISNNSADGRGGGLLLAGGDATLSGNTISNNSAELGGGLCLTLWSTVKLINNLVADNQASDRGCGLYIDKAWLHLLHTTIARNCASGGRGDGSAVYLTGDLELGYSTVTMTNTILDSHAVGIYVEPKTQATLENTLLNGNTANWSGGGRINHFNDHTGNPAFVDPDNGDYHIRYGSAAIDAAVDAGVDHDMDGEPRPLGAGYDIGADEYDPVLVVNKRAYPDPVAPGAQLTYTIRATNISGLTLTVTITDTLPLSVTLGGTLIPPGGTLTPPGGTVALPDGRMAVVWTAVLTAPGGTWVGTIRVTVDEGYAGPLTNLVKVATEEGVIGEALAIVNAYKVYLPFVLRESKGLP